MHRRTYLGRDLDDILYNFGSRVTACRSDPRGWLAGVFFVWSLSLSLSASLSLSLHLSLSLNLCILHSGEKRIAAHLQHPAVKCCALQCVAVHCSVGRCCLVWPCLVWSDLV